MRKFGCFVNKASSDPLRAHFLPPRLLPGLKKRRPAAGGRAGS